MLINYSDGILSYIASIRNYFGLDSSYESNVSLDNLINTKKPKKIFLFLIDGMGANLIEKKLDKDAFLRKHMLYKTKTVFPATTTAATTSIRNGKAPNENAWLGWMQYIKEENDYIIPFKGVGYYNCKEYGPSYYSDLVPVTFTEDELGSKAKIVFPSFIEGGYEDIDSEVNELIRCSNYEDYKYIYAYWDKYDTYMHEYGPSDKICDSYLLHINYELERLANNLNEDTMLVIVADHGQVDINRYYDFRGSQFVKMFAKLPSLETRAQMFYIKDEYKEEFESLFKKTFEKEYILLNKKEIFESKIFGDMINHPKFEDYIGDYLAIAISDMAFVSVDKEYIKGHHAGLCDDETTIPVIVYYK